MEYLLYGAVALFVMVIAVIVYNVILEATAVEAVINPVKAVINPVKAVINPGAEVYMSKNGKLIFITNKIVTEYEKEGVLQVTPILDRDSFEHYLNNECVKLGVL